MPGWKIIPKFMPVNNRLRIAYLSSSDPLDKRSWSGTHYAIYTALQKQVGEVKPLGPWSPKRLIDAGRAYSFLQKRLTGKRFDYSHSIRIARAYGKYFTEKLKQTDCDIVFAVSASSELAFLETDKPVYYLADATFANMNGYYPFYTNLSKISQQESNRVQQMALDKCNHLFFPSAWAAHSAVADYGIAPGKVHIVPFGANLESVPVYTERANRNSLHLLFLGVEWERKGGPVAEATLYRLLEQGIDARLTIVGCTPDIRHERITIIPYLNKNDAAQRARLNEIFSETDFLVLPTTAECYGIVFCEASAFGIPSLSTDTGGVSGAVRNGVNGFLFPPGTNASAFAEKIREYLESPEKLAGLKHASRKLFEEELNWHSWGKKISSVIG